MEEPQDVPTLNWLFSMGPDGPYLSKEALECIEYMETPSDTPNPFLNNPQLRRELEADRGLPQGAPTSPFLSNIVMRDYIKSCRNQLLVVYADDFLKVARKHKGKYLPLPKEKYMLKQTDFMKASGMEFAPEKSG